MAVTIANISVDELPGIERQYGDGLIIQDCDLNLYEAANVVNEGDEVHRTGDDLVRVALGQRVQIDAVEVHLEGVVLIVEVVGLAKGPLNLLGHGQQGVLLAVLQNDAGLPTVEDALAGGDAGNGGFPVLFLL